MEVLMALIGITDARAPQSTLSEELDIAPSKAKALSDAFEERVLKQVVAHAEELGHILKGSPISGSL